MTTDPTLRIATCTSMHELASLAPAIDELNASSRRPSPFSTFAFLSTHVAHDDVPCDGVRASLLALLAHRGDRLVGFLPLRHRYRVGSGRPFTRVEWLVNSDSDNPRLIAIPGEEAQCAAAFVDRLRADRTWASMVLSGQDAESPLRPAAHALPRWGYRVIDNADRPSASLSIRGTTLEDYYRSLGAKMRGNTRRLARRLFAAGDVSYISSDDATALEPLLEVYLDVESRSWKAGTGAAVGTWPHRTDFLRECLRGNCGMSPSMRILALSGLPIAVLVVGTFGNEVHALKMAYDERYAACTPGGFLMFLSIGDATEAGARTFNLLRGLDYFKARFGATVVETSSIQVLRAGRAPFRHAALKRMRRRRGSARAPRPAHNPTKRAALDPSRLDRADLERADTEQSIRRLAAIVTGPGSVRVESHDLLADRLPFPVGR